MTHDPIDPALFDLLCTFIEESISPHNECRLIEATLLEELPNDEVAVSYSGLETLVRALRLSELRLRKTLEVYRDSIGGQVVAE